MISQQACGLFIDLYSILNCPIISSFRLNGKNLRPYEGQKVIMGVTFPFLSSLGCVWIKDLVRIKEKGP